LKLHTLILTIMTLPCIGRANTSFITDPGSGSLRTGGSPSFGFSLGAQFTLSTVDGLDGFVLALGIYDPSGNALNTDHEIGLWDVTAGNTMVADATVTAGTTNSGVPGFLYVTLPVPVLLIDGDVYKLAAYYSQTSTDTLLDNNGTPTIDPNFSNTHGIFDPTGAVGQLSEPTGTAGNPYVGPNLQFQPIPEPGTGALLLVVCALAGWHARIRSLTVAAQHVDDSARAVTEPRA
jgi:hypothetical protein